jgi:hypothetical protein
VGDGWKLTSDGADEGVGIGVRESCDGVEDGEPRSGDPQTGVSQQPGVTAGLLAGRHHTIQAPFPE